MIDQERTCSKSPELFRINIFKIIKSHYFIAMHEPDSATALFGFSLVRVFKKAYLMMILSFSIEALHIFIRLILFITVRRSASRLQMNLTLLDNAF